ncbi:TWiK family of potassium channels protein 9, partial [Trichostrongylus colubriformis]
WIELFDRLLVLNFSANRTRKCVLAALQRLGAASNCSQHLDSTHLSWLDECYRHEDHRRIATDAPMSDDEKKAKSKGDKSMDGKDYDYWTLMDSVLFCYTVITTIGYGNVAPRTFNGRIFVILYGLIGVPFTMLAIANLGKFLATVLKSWTRPFVKCARRLRRRLCKPKYTTREKQRLMERESRKSVKPRSNDEDGSSDTDDELDEEEDATSDGIVLFVSFVIYIVIGSLAIAAYEPNMGVFEAIYFNFVTLTTIGLGDLVPQSDTYLVITLVYCTVGLALTTIAIEIAADTLKKISMKALVKNLGDQFNVPIDEIDTLNLEQFVDNAIKVQEGELATLRVDKTWMKSNYWQAIESGTMHYVDDDDLVTLQSNRNYYSEF